MNKNNLYGAGIKRENVPVVFRSNQEMVASCLPTAKIENNPKGFYHFGSLVEKINLHLRRKTHDNKSQKNIFCSAETFQQMLRQDLFCSQKHSQSVVTAFI